LTGLANRSAFVERISQYLGMARHTQARFVVAIADPERFEVLNNTLGREGGINCCSLRPHALPRPPEGVM